MSKTKEGNNEKIDPVSNWTIRKYKPGADVPYETKEIKRNLIVDVGGALQLDLFAGTGTPFNAANAQISVGDNGTAADVTQTGLLGTSASAGMNATFPSRSGRVLSFESSFAAGVASFDWLELSLGNGTTAFNRKLMAEGVKPADELWRVTLTLTSTA